MYYIPYTVLRRLRNYISMQTYMLAKHGISVTSNMYWKLQYMTNIFKFLCCCLFL